MTKCPKCGFSDPFWVPDWRDIEREWAKVEDVKELADKLPLMKITVLDGFAYRKGTKYVRRMAVEIYNSRGKWSKPRGYWETRDAVKTSSSVFGVQDLPFPV